MKRSKFEFPLRATLLYLLFGFLWILFSDRALSILVPQAEQQAAAQTFKGWFFILLSGSLLYGLLRGDAAKRRKSEQQIAWLAAFPAQNPNPVIEIDTAGRVSYMNPAAQQKFPALQAEGSRHPWLEGLDSVIAGLQGQESKQFEREVQIGDIWFSQQLHYLSSTRCLRIYGIDITKRKQAERKLLQMKRLYATLSQVNQTIVRVNNRDDLYRSICEVAVEFGEFSVAWIGLLDETSGDVQPVLLKSQDPREWEVPQVNIHSGPLSGGLIARAFRTGNVVTSNNMQNEEHLQPLHEQMRQHGFQSAAIVPFRVLGRTTGVLALLSRELGSFENPEEVRLLDEMGLDISFALDNIEHEVERKRAEQQLSESEMRFRLLFENNHTVMLLIDPLSGAIKSANKAAEAFYGYPLSGLLSMKIDEINELSSEEVQKECMRALKEEQKFFNFKHRLANGEVRSVEIRSAPIEVNGETLLFSIVNDVTERKRSQEQLARSELILRLFVENAPAAIAMFDRDMVYMSASRRFLSDYGLGDLDVIGRSHYDVFPEIPERWKEIHKRCLAGATESADEDPFLRSDGRMDWIRWEIHPWYESEGRIGGIILFSEVITERKQTEDYIAYQANLLASVSDAIIACDMSSLITSWNPAAEAIYGWQAEEVMGRLLDDFLQTAYPQTNSQSQAYQQLLTEGVWKGEVTQNRKDGSRITVLASISLIRDEAGTPAAMVATNRDISARKHAEEELRTLNDQLEGRVAERTRQLHKANTDLERASRTKDEFLANMSHELRTPLNSILGLSESLMEQRRGTLNESQHRSLEIIASSGRHLLELINDILDLSKIEAGKLDFYPQAISMDELCRSSLPFIRAQAARKFITVEYLNEASISRIFADPRRLKQILVNLLTNAVKFTPDNGTVTLKVTCEPEADIIRFAVIDTGIGIAADDLQRLFQPFVQVDSSLNRQHEGTGLGLALVRKLVDLHSGSVHVESEVGKGSTFTIHLSCNQAAIEAIENPPRQTPPTTAHEKPAVPVESAASLGRILLAEDNMPNVLTIGEYLESHGYEVVVAHDGLEALALATATNPHLILMDIQMPAMNGLEAIARLRADGRFTHVPIVALTALAMPGDRERCLQVGANEYMSKPVSLKALLKTVEALLKPHP